MAQTKNKKKKNTKKKTNTKKSTNVKKNTTKSKSTTVKKKNTNTKGKVNNKKKTTKKKLTKKEIILNELNSIKTKILNIKLSDKTRNILMKISIVLLVLAILILIPYGKSIYSSGASELNIEVPKFMLLESECCSYQAKFSTLRSAASIKYDFLKLLSSYEEVNCDGNTYYYNSENDYTVVSYTITKGLVNHFTISYVKGNTCEVDTTFKNIGMLPDDYSINDAITDGNLVIENGVMHNKSTYDKFIDSVKNNTKSTLRIVKESENKSVIVIDLEYNNGKYKVVADTTRDETSEYQDSIMAYQYEHIGILNNILYAYNGSSIDSSSYLLFEFE